MDGCSGRSQLPVGGLWRNMVTAEAVAVLVIATFLADFLRRS
jgi:hypothetical protein